MIIITFFCCFCPACCVKTMTFLHSSICPTHSFTFFLTIEKKKLPIMDHINQRNNILFIAKWNFNMMQVVQQQMRVCCVTKGQKIVVNQSHWWLAIFFPSINQERPVPGALSKYKAHQSFPNTRSCCKVQWDAICRLWPSGSSLFWLHVNTPRNTSLLYHVIVFSPSSGSLPLRR